MKSSDAFCLAVLLVSPLTPSANAQPASRGPDVFVSELGVPAVLNPEDFSKPDSVMYFAASTTACNAGDAFANWIRLPDNRHPVIGLNLYRVVDGKMSQIGQSWLKHAFSVVEANACHRPDLHCEFAGNSQQLSPGCSDAYGDRLNRGPKLGSRSLVNPLTGNFDGPAAIRQRDDIGGLRFERSLEVKSADLRIPNADYFIEAQYISPDDAKAGNGLNNVSHRQIEFISDSNGRLRARASGADLVVGPAILSWSGAQAAVVDGAEVTPQGESIVSRVIVTAKVTPLTSGSNRYDYAVYNMNSQRGIRSVSIPVGGATVSSFGMSAVASHGEQWSNDPWEKRVEGGSIVWEVPTFDVNPNANAIRWGTTYNFWFESPNPPVSGKVSLKKFGPGENLGELSASLPVPSP